MTDPRDLEYRDNIPANPYPADVPRLEDKPGYPWATPWFRADLTDEAQLGGASPPAAVAPVEGEPTFTLRASDRLSGMVVRAWANLAAELGLTSADEIAGARKLALAMDEWRRTRNSAGG